MLPLDCDWQSQLATRDSFWHMQKNQVGCDVVFEVDKKKERVGAHSFVLMSRSTRFFHDHLTVSASPFIPLPEVNSISLKEFLRYLYTDVTDYTNWRETLYLAYKYEVKPLIEMIFDEKLSKCEATEFCYQMKQYENLEGYLEYRCMKHVFENPKPIFDCDIFHYLPHSFVLKLLSSEYLVHDENLIYNAMYLWAEKACLDQLLDGTGANKRKVLGDILFHIRFPLLPQEFFSEHVSEQGLLEEGDEIKIFKHYLHPKKPLGNDFKFKTEPRKAPAIPFQYVPWKFERWRPLSQDCSVDEAAEGLSEVRISDDGKSSIAAAAGSSLGACGVEGMPVIRKSDQASVMSHYDYNHDLESDLWNMERFKEKEYHEGWGYKKETVDAIAVVSDRDIAISSMSFYGVEAGKKMTGRFKIYHDNKEGFSQEFSVTCYKERRIYEFYIKGKVKFWANEEYHILLDMEEGSNGFYGKGGKSQVKVGGTTISIKPSKYSTNQTDVHMGQIFGFMFRTFKPVSVKYGMHFPQEEPLRYHP